MAADIHQLSNDLCKATQRLKALDSNFSYTPRTFGAFGYELISVVTTDIAGIAAEFRCDTNSAKYHCEVYVFIVVSLNSRKNSYE